MSKRGPYGVRSKACSLCRQRRIKCDEKVPVCTQCKTSGRTCPGAITGIIVRDMTLTLNNTNPAKQTGTSSRVRNVKKSDNARDQPVTGSRIGADDRIQAMTEYRGTSNSFSLDLVASQLVTTIPSYIQKEDTYSALGRPSAGIDPLSTLPLGSHFSVSKLIDYCVHSMGDTLVELGPGDPMRDLWLPRAASDQLLLQCIIYAASVHMSAICGMDLMFNTDVITHRVESLALLNQRLSNPRHAVNDITLTAVLRILGQVIVCENIKETELHLDGIQKMFRVAPYFQPNDNVREVMFWSDLIGSALCHTPPRQFTTRPPTRSFCHPLFLNPCSTIGVLCRGFRKPLLAQSTVFGSIAEILHDLRCLTTVLHYSRYKGLPRHEMPIYKDLCYNAKHRLGLLSPANGSPQFECCRLAVMVFTDSVLLGENSNLHVLAVGLKTVLVNSLIERAMDDTPELLLWILFMGIIASEDMDINTWFKSYFARVLSKQKRYDFDLLRRILVEFLWLQDVLDQNLRTIWTDLEKLINY